MTDTNHEAIVSDEVRDLVPIYAEDIRREVSRHEREYVMGKVEHIIDLYEAILQQQGAEVARADRLAIALDKLANGAGNIAVEGLTDLVPSLEAYIQARRIETPWRRPALTTIPQGGDDTEAPAGEVPALLIHCGDYIAVSEHGVFKGCEHLETDEMCPLNLKCEAQKESPLHPDHRPEALEDSERPDLN